jgi:hypothetical protein
MRASAEHFMNIASLAVLLGRAASMQEGKLCCLWVLRLFR